jgi:hypothetical protein
MGSAAHTGAGGDDSVQDDDSSNFHILSKLDLNHIRVDPKASKMYSAEVQKALNVAVSLHILFFCSKTKLIPLALHSN